MYESEMFMFQKYWIIVWDADDEFHSYGSDSSSEAYW
jgi:hypothetical protein